MVYSDEASFVRTSAVAGYVLRQSGQPPATQKGVLGVYTSGWAFAGRNLRYARAALKLTGRPRVD
jgi:hypothetical protein